MEAPENPIVSWIKSIFSGWGSSDEADEQTRQQAALKLQAVQRGHHARQTGEAAVLSRCWNIYAHCSIAQGGASCSQVEALYLRDIELQGLLDKGSGGAGGSEYMLQCIRLRLEPGSVGRIEYEALKEIAVTALGASRPDPAGAALRLAA